MRSTMRSAFSVPMPKQIMGDKIMEHIDRSVKSKPQIGPPVSSWRLVLITFTLSAVMLAYEILLTRIASVLLTNQYVFLIVGVSLLGISIGAVCEYFYSRRQSGSSERDNFPVLGILLTVLALVAAIILILKIGPTQGKTVVALSAALPFTASGFVFSRLFRLFTGLTGLLYAFDLFGAAVGALIFPALIDWQGPIQAILFLSAVLSAISLIATAMAFKRWLLTIPVMLIACVLFLVNSGNALLGDVPIGRDPNKDLYRLMSTQANSAKIIDSRWSAFGRTDLVRFDSDSSLMAIFIDGAAGANMIRFNGSLTDSTNTIVEAVGGFGGMLPLLDLPDSLKNYALVIGPGGGRDVLLALKAGYKKITAVDINPQMISIVKGYSGFNGGIYTNFRNVKVVVAEGRNYVRRSDQHYDLITLFMPITKSSQSLNAFALSESYLFTKNAFEDYYDHLTNKGTLLVMAHNMPEAAKMMTTAVAALQSEGLSVQQAMRRLYILGSDMMPLFGLRKTPLPTWEAAFLHLGVHNFGQFDPRLSYIPGAEQQMARLPLSTSIDQGVPMMNPVFAGLADGKLPLASLETGTGMNLVPPTDNRPFFFQYDFSTPQILFTLLWLSLGLLVAVLFIPAPWFKGVTTTENTRHNVRKFSWWLPVFFISIGIGYIIIELALFQKLVFYLGDPSRSLALLLAALLAGSGAGSLLSNRTKPSGAVVAGLASAVLALVILFIAPPIFNSLQAASLSTLKIFAAVVLFVQGFPMGMMFPTGLRVAEKRLGGPAIPWMWAINGSASVVGSAIAIVIAMTNGYDSSLAVGAISYLVAASALAIVLRRNPVSRTSAKED